MDGVFVMLLSQNGFQERFKHTAKFIVAQGDYLKEM
jgi:hypothetical protein